jgi:hypothetical protein
MASRSSGMGDEARAYRWCEQSSGVSGTEWSSAEWSSRNTDSAAASPSRRKRLWNRLGNPAVNIRCEHDLRNRDHASSRLVQG